MVTKEEVAARMVANRRKMAEALEDRKFWRAMELWQPYGGDKWPWPARAVS